MIESGLSSLKHVTVPFGTLEQIHHSYEACMHCPLSMRTLRFSALLYCHSINKKCQFMYVLLLHFDLIHKTVPYLHATILFVNGSLMACLFHSNLTNNVRQAGQEGR